MSPLHNEGTELGGEDNTDYGPPFDDEDYRPSQSTPSQKRKKQKVGAEAESNSDTTFSAHASPYKSRRGTAPPSVHAGKRHYKHTITSRNFQRKRGARPTDRLSKFQCPVVGCNYVQKNRRVPDLKRHIVIHDRWLEPDKWICCGVATENAHLYGIVMEKGMNEEELAEAGAYVFRGKSMVGGCLKTFDRRDALKRHVDNTNISCVGDMDLYFC